VGGSWDAAPLHARIRGDYPRLLLAMCAVMPGKSEPVCWRKPTHQQADRQDGARREFSSTWQAANAKALKITARDATKADLEPAVEMTRKTSSRQVALNTPVHQDTSSMRLGELVKIRVMT